MEDWMKWLWILLVGYAGTCGASVKAVLFDCDGTLVDSEPAHWIAWRRAMNDFGSDLTVDDYYAYAGKSAVTNARLFAERMGQDCAAPLLEKKRAYYEELCQAGLPSIEPTIRFLHWLVANKESLGIKLGVCSAAKRVNILEHLRHLEIDHLFDIILSGQDDLGDYSDPEGVNKPKPYIYQHAMKLLQVLPHDTVVIEDSGPGVLAGASAGCFTIAVPNAFTQQHDFREAHWQLPSFEGMSGEDVLDRVHALQTSRRPAPPS